jgi:hypothetical protein
MQGNYQTWLMCLGCEHHYIVIDNLATHLNNIHCKDFLNCHFLWVLNFFTVVNKAYSSSTTPLEVHVREPSDMQSPKCVKKRRTSNEIHQSIFNYSSKAESAIGNNMLKTFDCSSSTIKITDSKRVSKVTIVSSKKDFNIPSSYNVEPVKIEMEPALEEEEQTEKEQYLSENYVNHFLQGSRFAWLIKQNGDDEINQQCLSILNFDWTNKPWYRIACGQLLSDAILVRASPMVSIYFSIYIYQTCVLY